MNEELIGMVLYITVLAFGLHYIVAYAFRRSMYIPGETLKGGEKPFGRVFVLLLGIAMVSWAGYSLLK